MPRYKIGETVLLDGRQARIVWLSENPSEVEAIDEYIVEFDDKHRKFVVSSSLDRPKKSQPIHDGEHDSDPCHGQAY
jgi:hypothetical protein